MLITALKSGDEKAFKNVYEIYAQPLFKFVIKYTKSKTQAEDIVQETFLKIWNIREQLNNKLSIKSLLYKIAYNLFIDKYRSKQRELKMLDGWMYKRLLEIIDGEEEIKKQKIKLIEEAIEKLPPRCKEVFILNKFKQLKYREIAERLDISIKTVEVQMGKAFTIIRKEANKKPELFLFILKLFNIPNKN